MRSLEELELLIRSSGEEGTLEPEALDPAHPLDPLRREGRRRRARPAPLGAVTLSIDDVVADLAERSVATGHSRFPVVGADLDDVRGVVHVKDVYGVPYEERARTPVESIMVPAFVVPETRDLADLLADLRRVGTPPGGGRRRARRHGRDHHARGRARGDRRRDRRRARPRRRRSLTRVQRPGEWLLDGTLHPDEVFDACGFSVPGRRLRDARRLRARPPRPHPRGRRAASTTTAGRSRSSSSTGMRVATVRLRRAGPLAGADA